jgi:hypothetical protein
VLDSGLGWDRTESFVRGGGDRKDKLLNKACVLYALQPPQVSSRNKRNTTGPDHVEPNVFELETSKTCHLGPLSGQMAGIATSIRKMGPSPNKGPSDLANAGASPVSTHA